MNPLENRELLPESPYIWRARNPAHTHRLICFPHAGAGATAFSDWVPFLPPEIELVAVQLPGRQNRIAEEPFVDTGPLLTVLTHALRPVLDGRFAFFGHSGGAALAYELATALRSRGRRGPEQLFLSARPAPHTTEIRQLHDLSDDELLAELVALGGIENEIAEDRDVMAALLPLLRTDFGLWERHRSTPRAPLDCPITVLCGTSDPRAPLETVDEWRAHTTAGFSTRFYPGGHFYFLEWTADVVRHMCGRLLAATTDRKTA
ncbi:MAG TPA: alpha/beta fold hydrolase [Actinophytocola sp.]|uniref:thioesterase II family protein n=1 Tax=Actinophytocola sp. TaxID=1872138 RepID=UPI002DBE8E9D|nr:alpha/beta fold hydrolase [Actinophytocola sp.]HEU5471985.1 alpha/beta fold hydrolase [Actinophytocola sp.]